MLDRLASHTDVESIELDEELSPPETEGEPQLPTCGLGNFTAIVRDVVCDVDVSSSCSTASAGHCQAWRSQSGFTAVGCRRS